MAIARAIDLTGHANSQSHLEDVILDAYKDGILDEIGKPTILLGNSIIAALAIPDLINQLMFLCAYVPQDGKNTLDLITDQPEKPLRSEILMRQDRLGFRLSLTRQKEPFDNDYTDEAGDYGICNS